MNILQINSFYSNHISQRSTFNWCDFYSVWEFIVESHIIDPLHNIFYRIYNASYYRSWGKKTAVLVVVIYFISSVIDIFPFIQFIYLIFNHSNQPRNVSLAATKVPKREEIFCRGYFSASYQGVWFMITFISCYVWVLFHSV